MARTPDFLCRGVTHKMAHLQAPGCQFVQLHHLIFIEFSTDNYCLHRANCSFQTFYKGHMFHLQLLPPRLKQLGKKIQCMKTVGEKLCWVLNDCCYTDVKMCGGKVNGKMVNGALSKEYLKCSTTLATLTHSYTDSRRCHAKNWPAHQVWSTPRYFYTQLFTHKLKHWWNGNLGFSILPKDISPCSQSRRETHYTSWATSAT